MPPCSAALVHVWLTTPALSAACLAPTSCAAVASAAARASATACPLPAADASAYAWARACPAGLPQSPPAVAMAWDTAWAVRMALSQPQVRSSLSLAGVGLGLGTGAWGEGLGGSLVEPVVVALLSGVTGAGKHCRRQNTGTHL